MGGTTGLGLSGAQACVSQGAQVVVVGRSASSGQAALHQLGEQNARLVVGDATDPACAREAINLALRDFGRFDGLYHVAGGSGRSRGDGPLDQLSDEGWKYMLDQNLTSLFYSNRAAVQQFLKQGSAGTVLNMGSVLGFSPSPRYFATHAYATTKAAIVGLTKSTAAYYADQSIRINVVAPALVETPMAQRAAGDEKIMNFISTKQPLDGGRIGQPTDLDGAVVYLLSDEARFVTGQVLYVDGGWSVSEGRQDSQTNMTHNTNQDQRGKSN